MGRAIRKSVLRKQVEKCKADTNVVRMAKRDKKSKKGIIDSEENKLNICLDYDECGQSRERVLSFVDVREWFREGIIKRLSWSVTLPANDKWWGGKQGLLSRKLLDAYDGELVKKAIFYLCDNWEDMVRDSGGRLSGLPTIELLWSIRDRIFPEAERGRQYVSPRKRTVPTRELPPDEYRVVEGGKVGHGW